MTESEAIKELETSIDLAKMCTQNYERKNEIQGYEMAIKALEEVQQYQALEKRLSDMFGGSLSLKMCVDELERILTEPDSPHPMNAKILTYQEAADWEAYRAIGTVEELIRGKRYMNIAKRHGTIGQVIDECVAYEAIGTVEECREAVEKQTAKKVKSISQVKDGDSYVGIIGRCPCCGDILEEDTVYCDCGQKLDWRNEE